MRLGVAWVPSPNANYRAVFPLREMARRGHEVVVTPDPERRVDLRAFAGCDVVHVYRRTGADTRQALSALASAGAAITYDNDDDIAERPEETPGYAEYGAMIGRAFASSVEPAGMAHVFTTPTETLAERYRDAGVGRIEVVPNCVSPDVQRTRTAHDGIVIGWIAGVEHTADVVRIPIEDALQRLIDTHPEVRVETVGVKLRLSERYHHEEMIDFEGLPGRMATFDIGIAPLADIPFNRARSEIKLKEYAASGVPWLASPVGPYAGLGEAEGGRLVPDDGWYDALEALVTDPDRRARLGRNAEAWAQNQTMAAVADRWEQIFVGALARRQVWSPATSISARGQRYLIQMPPTALRRR
jgi:glycosyltransferase involved in cell wall biosynthesis